MTSSRLARLDLTRSLPLRRRMKPVTTVKISRKIRVTRSGPGDRSALLARARAIAERAARAAEHRAAMVGEATRELQLATTWHLRRAAVAGSVDNLVYGHGSAEQALGALDLCPIATLGFKAAGALTYPWLIEAAAVLPQGSYPDHLRLALCDLERRRFCIALGSWHRFQWKLSVYRREVEEWHQKPIAQDPLSKWRRRQITAKQRYLVDLITECLSAMDPAFPAPELGNRGEAHDWLRAHGGNPLFWHPPVRPSLDLL